MSELRWRIPCKEATACENNCYDPLWAERKMGYGGTESPGFLGMAPEEASLQQPLPVGKWCCTFRDKSRKKTLVSGCQGNLGDRAEWEDGPRALAP